MINFRDQVRALFIAIFTWMIVINGQDLIVKYSPIENQLIIGVIGLVTVLLWKK